MNRLAHETSPYLLQHKDNPVDWYPWGEEALERARARGQAAARLDRLLGLPLVPRDGARVVRGRRGRGGDERAFVCVKVDREERPDVDAIYMDAVQAMTGHGGWPLNAFLTPDGVPFYAGTYFPPEPRHNMPSWRMVLEGVGARVDRAARRDRRHVAADRRAPAGVRGAAGAGRRARPALARRRGHRPQAQPTTRRTAAGAARRSSRAASTIEFLLRRGERQMALHTLRRMAVRRDLRPGRRRLLALLGRRPVARAALREDALRQRAARPRVPARVPGLAASRSSSASRARRSTGRCASCARTRAASRARSTPTPRASRASSTCGRLDEVRDGARPRARGRRDRALRHVRGRQLRGREHRRARDAGPASGWTRSRPACSPRASAACARGSTTSA